MNDLQRDSVCILSRRRAAAIWIFFALNLAVYLIRIVSVWRYGALFSPTAVESPMIDSLWRCMNHQPVYQNSFAFPFSLSLYNYLFYFVYAGALRLMGVWNEGILTWGRQLTLLFALAGAVAQWRLVRALLKLRGAASTLSLAFAVGLWICTSLVKYWALSIRPDMAAAALVMIALWVIARQPQPQSSHCFAWAGLLLNLAWAFKQSAVLTVAGLCLWLVLNKRWRDLALLTTVFAALAGITLLLGTPEYRFSILVAPQMVRGFSFGLPWILHALGTGLTAIALNLYWAAAPFLLLRASGSQNAEHFLGAPSIPLLFEEKTRNGRVSTTLTPVQINSMLLTIFSVALIAGLAGMGKIGGTSNYLFEAFVAGSTLLQLAVFSVPARLVTALILFGCVQPAVQLGGAAIGYHHPGKKDMVPIATASEYRDAVALRNRLAAMQKPLFTTYGPFELPWISTENDAPALVIDPNFQEAARTREADGGIEGMLRRGEIPTVLLAASDFIYLKSLNPCYRKVGESIQQGIAYSIYEFHPSPANLY